MHRASECGCVTLSIAQTLPRPPFNPPTSLHPCHYTLKGDRTPGLFNYPGTTPLTKTRPDSKHHVATAFYITHYYGSHIFFFLNNHYFALNAKQSMELAYTYTVCTSSDCWPISEIILFSQIFTDPIRPAVL